jgi:hypothetical protein
MRPITQQAQSSLNNRKTKPVYFISKSMTEAERNYKIHNKEMLAIMRALREWQPWLIATLDPFEIHMDHINLKYFLEAQKLNRRQVRWSLDLQDYNFRLIH